MTPLVGSARPSLVAAVLVGLAASAIAAAVAVIERDRLLARAGAPSSTGHPRPSSVGRVLARVVPSARALGGLFAGLLVGGPPLGAAGLVAAVAVPRYLRRRKERKRAELAEEQLADRVATLAAALRAGLSLSQAVRYAAEEGQPPMSEELREVVDREALGVPLDASLAAWAKADRTEEVRLVANVLSLHHRVGGDLPVVLDQIVRTLRQRRSAARELRSLTAQGRLSGAILGFLPIGFFMFLSLTSRAEVEAAYRSPVGLTAIVVGLALEVGAFLWIRALLRMEPT